MVAGEVGGVGGRRTVHQEADVALFQPDDVGPGVHMGLGEAHRLQARDHRLGLWAGEFDEFETVDAEGVLQIQLLDFGLGHVVHGASPAQILRRSYPEGAADWGGT